MKSMFISMPMNGRNMEEILQEFIKLKAKFTDYEVIDSYGHDKIEKDVKNTSVRYLADSIKHLSKADVVLFLKGWDEARGCRIEHEIAKQYGIEVMYEQ